MNNIVDENMCNSSVDSEFFYGTESIIIEEEVQNKFRTYSNGNLPKSKSQIELKEEKIEKVVGNKDEIKSKRN